MLELLEHAFRQVPKRAAGPVPIGTLSDGTEVFGRTGAMSELAITGEEMVTPIFTSITGPEIAMLTCVGGCGLGMTMTNAPVDVASDVVIFGAGPVGLSAVMGAKVKGASRIIVVEPIPYRRELALKLGATDVVDPNRYKGRQPIPNPPANGDRFKDELVDYLREMTKPRTDRLWSGGGKNRSRSRDRSRRRRYLEAEDAAARAGPDRRDRAESVLGALLVHRNTGHVQRGSSKGCVRRAPCVPVGRRGETSLARDGRRHQRSA